mgnify:CR=1 FL=1
MIRRRSPHQMQPLAVRSSLPRSYCLIILTYSNELRCYELLLWEVVGGYPSYLHINHRRNPHTQVPPNPPEILSLPRPIVHGQIDSLGLKQAGWGASGVGGLAMGQGPLSLFLKVWTELCCCLVSSGKARLLATSLFHRTVQAMLSGTHLGRDRSEFTS